jgi:hypothetical protein
MLCNGKLTQRVGVVELEAAEDLVRVPGMEKSVASHYHLETLWK